MIRLTCLKELMLAIVSANKNYYRIHFVYIYKDEAINVLRNADLTEKKWNIIENKS